MEFLIISLFAFLLGFFYYDIIRLFKRKKNKTKYNVDKREYVSPRAFKSCYHRDSLKNYNQTKKILKSINYDIMTRSINYSLYPSLLEEESYNNNYKDKCYEYLDTFKKLCQLGELASICNPNEFDALNWLLEKDQHIKDYDSTIRLIKSNSKLNKILN